MKLLIALITYNRLEYTKRTLRNLHRTIQVPYFLVVVDNNSTDGTREYLEAHKKRNKIDHVILNPDNYYPGKATNIGWSEGLKLYPQATHLCRLDNDMDFAMGWDLRAEEYFHKIERLGQLGLDFDGSEGKSGRMYNGYELREFPGCVGGPNIIHKHIFTGGTRYDEMRWNDGRKSKLQEDSLYSKKIKDKGYLVGHMDERLSWTFADESNWADFPKYYEQTMSDRGYEDKADLARGMK